MTGQTLLLLLCSVGVALADAPRIDRIIPSMGQSAVPLSPGELFSVYGTGLGPLGACEGLADVTRMQPVPEPRFRWRTEMLIYPEQLCGVQVMVAGKRAGLLYVHD